MARLTDDQTEKSASSARRRPSLSREAFLDRAFEIFTEAGYERTSIDAISAEAGIAKRTVYQRFGDKETLFKEAVQRAVQKWIVPIEKLREVESDDLADTLRAIAQLLMDNLLSPGGLQLLRLSNAVSSHMPEISAQNVKRGLEPTLAYLADLFRRRVGPDLRCFGTAEGAAMAYMNLVTGGPASLTAWGVSLDRAFIEEYMASSVELFLHGLLPSPDWSEFEKLREENGRLKRLLGETMLQLDASRRGPAEAEEG